MTTIKGVIQLLICVEITVILLPLWFVVIFLDSVCTPLKKTLKWLANLACSAMEIS